MKIETKQVYTAEDGKVFDNEEACVKYEAQLAAERARFSYWLISHDPDLTEGRGRMSTTKVRFICGDTYLREPYMQTYCFQKFGGRVDYAQGVSPMIAWTLTEIDEEKFNDKPLPSYGGMSSQQTKRLEVVPRANGKFGEEEIKQ